MSELCPPFEKAKESKRKQEEARERKEIARGRKIRKAGGIRHVQRGKRVCDVEFEFAVARRVHLIQVCLDPSSFPIELQENFL